MAGPEYALNGENGPLDNASITKTQQRLHGVVAALKAVSPAPQVRRANAECQLGPLIQFPAVSGARAGSSCFVPLIQQLPAIALTSDSSRCLAAMWCTTAWTACATWG